MGAQIVKGRSGPTKKGEEDGDGIKHLVRTIDTSALGHKIRDNLNSNETERDMSDEDGESIESAREGSPMDLVT